MLRDCVVMLLWHLNKSLVMLTGCLVGGRLLKLQSCRYSKFFSQKFRSQILNSYQPKKRRQKAKKPVVCLIHTRVFQNLNTGGQVSWKDAKKLRWEVGSRGIGRPLASLFRSITMAEELSTWESGRAHFKFWLLCLLTVWNWTNPGPQLPHLKYMDITTYITKPL